jgi:hypothetical protein
VAIGQQDPALAGAQQEDVTNPQDFSPVPQGSANAPVSPTPEQIREMQRLEADHQYNYRRTQLNPLENQKFQKDMTESAWGKNFMSQYGISPQQFQQMISGGDRSYDYAGAWKQGLVPEQPGQHWPDRGPDGKWLKSPEHPSAWMEYYQSVTGQDPDAVGMTPQKYQKMLQGRPESGHTDPTQGPVPAQVAQTRTYGPPFNGPTEPPAEDRYRASYRPAIGSPESEAIGNLGKTKQPPKPVQEPEGKPPARPTRDPRKAAAEAGAEIAQKYLSQAGGDNKRALGWMLRDIQQDPQKVVGEIADVVKGKQVAWGPFGRKDKTDAELMEENRKKEEAAKNPTVVPAQPTKKKTFDEILEDANKGVPQKSQYMNPRS